MGTLVFMVRMAVLMVVQMTVVLATDRRSGQPSGEIERNEGINVGIYFPGMHRDAVQGKVVERAFTDAAGDHHPYALFPQPARKRAGLVWRCGKRLGGKHGPLLGVGVHERELAAAAEMAVQSSVRGRDGNANGGFF